MRLSRGFELLFFFQTLLSDRVADPIKYSRKYRRRHTDVLSNLETAWEDMGYSLCLR